MENFQKFLASAEAGVRRTARGQVILSRPAEPFAEAQLITGPNPNGYSKF